MSTTPNLLISHIDQNQTQKEVTANTAFDDLDGAVAGTATINCAGNTDVTPTASTVQLAFRLKLTGALTGSIHLNLPTTAHYWLIDNQTTGAFNITVQVTGAPGTTEVICTGEYILIFSDGTNITRVSRPTRITVVDSTGNGADIGATNLIASPEAARYRISAYIIVTTVDGASSTLPSVVITWTDPDNSTAQTITLTPTNTGNLLTTYQQADCRISAKLASAIQYSTSGYASGTPGTMKFALHIVAEKM